MAPPLAPWRRPLGTKVPISGVAGWSRRASRSKIKTRLRFRELLTIRQSIRQEISQKLGSRLGSFRYLSMKKQWLNSSWLAWHRLGPRGWFWRHQRKHLERSAYPRWSFTNYVSDSAVSLLLVSSWPAGWYRGGIPYAWYAGGLQEGCIGANTTASSRREAPTRLQTAGQHIGYTICQVYVIHIPLCRYKYVTHIEVWRMKYVIHIPLCRYKYVTHIEVWRMKYVIHIGLIYITR